MTLDKKMMNRRRTYCIAVVLVMLCLPTRHASALMSKEAHDRINAHVEAIRAKVEKQKEPVGKQDVLRKAFAETEDPYVKKEILTMAVAVAGTELEPFLLTMLRDEPDVRLRIMAVKALADHGSPNAVQQLLNCAENDPEGEAGWACVRHQTTARRDAYFALSDIGLRHPAAAKSIAKSIAALPVTADDLRDPKTQALYVLTQDKGLLKPFFERLQDEDPKTRERGVVAFRFLKITQAPKELVGLLDDPTQGVRSWVALVLGEIGDPATVPALISTARDKKEDRGVRCNAINSLGRMRTKEAESVMRELLTDENVKVNAAISLSQITGERHPLVPEGYRLD